MPVEAAEGRGVIRCLACLALLVLTLAACKQPQEPSDASAGLLRGGTDIAIKNVRMSATGDNVGFGSDQFYVITFTFTDDLGYAVIPRIDHFVLEDRDHRRYLGADSGSPALVGISNDTEQLRPGDTHDYTVGFRVPQNTTGTLYYDATF